jgi:hypothetical protein
LEICRLETEGGGIDNLAWLIWTGNLNDDA